MTSNIDNKTLDRLNTYINEWFSNIPKIPLTSEGMKLIEAKVYSFLIPLGYINYKVKHIDVSYDRVNIVLKEKDDDDQ